MIQTYHTKVFARFVDRMAKTPEGDGSLLDHSMVLYGSNMSDSNRHNNDPLPSAILGHAHGRIKGGQHLHYRAGLEALESAADAARAHGDSDRVDRRQRQHVVGGLAPWHGSRLAGSARRLVALLGTAAAAAEPSLLDAAEAGDHDAALAALQAGGDVRRARRTARRR